MYSTVISHGYDLYAQTDNLTTNNNINAEVAPQGTSLQNTAAVDNITSTESRAGTIETDVVPQGTALQTSSNVTGIDTNKTATTTTSGTENITANVVPQGTSLNASE
jgi:hypothetical protein